MQRSFLDVIWRLFVPRALPGAQRNIAPNRRARKYLSMIQTASKPQTMDNVSSFREVYLRAYRFMLLARGMDDKFAGLYRAGKIHGGVFLSRGQEALSVSVGIALRKGDVFAPLIRDSAGRLALGEAPLDAARTYLGSSLGPLRGRDGNIRSEE